MTVTAPTPVLPQKYVILTLFCKPHFSPNRKIITAMLCSLSHNGMVITADLSTLFQAIYRRVAFERRPILLASRITRDWLMFMSVL